MEEGEEDSEGRDAVVVVEEVRRRKGREGRR